MNNFPGPVRSPQIFKYKENAAFTYITIFSVVHWRKFSMKQNLFKQAIVHRNWVLHYFSLFSIWTTKEMHEFQGYFSRTFQDQRDFPEVSRSWNFQEKIQDFPGGMGTLKKTLSSSSSSSNSNSITSSNTCSSNICSSNTCSSTTCSSNSVVLAVTITTINS